LLSAFAKFQKTDSNRLGFECTAPTLIHPNQKSSKIENHRMGKIIVLLGAPGAGKGTQARLLQERRQLPQISTGDILRAIAETDTPLGREVKQVQSAGKLISDDQVIRVVEERTGKEDSKNGYVLDGFPRTPAQAATLEELARQQGKAIQAVVVDVPFELLTKRATGRRSCPVCGEIYNLYSRPPKFDEECDRHPGVKLEHRADDTAEKISVRLKTYEDQTRPLIDYYDKSHRLLRVDGTQDPEAIYRQIEKILEDD
jgi:adenylate kinase